MYDEVILFSCILLLGIGIFGLVMVFRMIFRKGRIITGRPPEKDIYHDFVRAWNGKIYSCVNSKFIYEWGNGWVHLYKHDSGDYFEVSRSDYGGPDYNIHTKDEAKKLIMNSICNDNLEYVTELLKTEFNETLENNPCIEKLRAKKINKIKTKI